MTRMIPAAALEQRIREIDRLVARLVATRELYEEVLGYSIEIDLCASLLEDLVVGVDVELREPSREEVEALVRDLGIDVGEGSDDEEADAGAPQAESEDPTDDLGSCPDCFAELNGDGSCPTIACGDEDLEARDETAIDDAAGDWEDLTDYQREKLVEVARKGSTTMHPPSRRALLERGLVELGVDDRIRLLHRGRELLEAAGHHPNGGPA